MNILYIYMYILYINFVIYVYCNIATHILTGHTGFT